MFPRVWPHDFPRSLTLAAEPLPLSQVIGRAVGRWGLADEDNQVASKNMVENGDFSPSSESQMLHGAGIFTYIWVIFGVNVCKYSIHGASGYYRFKYHKPKLLKLLFIMSLKANLAIVNGAPLCGVVQSIVGFKAQPPRLFHRNLISFSIKWFIAHNISCPLAN